MKLFPLAILVVLALPAVAALPAVCGPDCHINASSLPGYDPIVAIIASGTTVTWHSTDSQHFTRDTSISGADQCFFADHPGGAASQPIVFDIVGDTLTATDNGVTSVCGNAMGNGAVGFEMDYFCVLHPFMRASLVVTN